jgi:hypothetical protein
MKAFAHLPIRRRVYLSHEVHLRSLHALFYQSYNFEHLVLIALGGDVEVLFYVERPSFVVRYGSSDGSDGNSVLAQKFFCSPRRDKITGCHNKGADLPLNIRLPEQVLNMVFTQDAVSELGDNQIGLLCIGLMQKDSSFLPLH